MKALALLAMLPLTAHAAEPALCRAYATKLLNVHMTWMWNRAYSGCLLQEEDDPQPPDNWQGAMRVIDPSLTPITTPEPPPKPLRWAPIDPPAVADPAPKAAISNAECATAHPRGYKNGTYNKLIKGKWVRVPCSTPWP